jgi:hypothetical protein
MLEPRRLPALWRASQLRIEIQSKATTPDTALNMNCPRQDAFQSISKSRDSGSVAISREIGDIG